jgi:nucleotide-binding universal stress UspA family protein
MFEKILFATDLGPTSAQLIESIPDPSRLGVKEVVLAHTIPLLTTTETEVPLIEEARGKLEGQASHLREKGIKVTLELVVALSARTFLDLADRHDVSMIALGTRFEGGQRGSMIGCTAYSILHETIRPTLLVPLSSKKAPVEQATGPSEWPGHILYPTDFSDTGEQALLYVESIAGMTGCSVTLYHVHDEARIDPYLRDRLPEFDRVDRQRMEKLREHLEFNGAGSCQVELSYGVPAQRLLAMARSGDYGLIVMGTQGRGYIPEVYLGSTANALARHSPIPVLFVPKRR